MQREVPPPEPLVGVEGLARDQRGGEEQRERRDKGQRQDDGQAPGDKDGRGRENRGEDGDRRQLAAPQQGRREGEGREGRDDPADDPAPQDGAERSGLLRIASYNIRKALGLDWRRDPARILRVLGEVGADVVALQEADLRLGARPAALPRDLLERHGWRVVPAGRGDSLGRHGNAVLLAPGVSLLDWEGIDLPGLEPRGAVLARLAVRGRPLTLAAAHLGLRRSDRRAQAAALLRHVEAAGDEAILAGDLNEWSARRGLEPVADALALHSPGRSFHAARPIAALDRIALAPGFVARGGGVLETPEAKRASDHLPIWLDVAWPDHVENRTGTSAERTSSPVVAPRKKS